MAMNNITIPGIDQVKLNDSTRKMAQQSVSAESRFRDILALMQDDGLIAKDAATKAATLPEEEKARLREAFDIGDMAPYANKRALLNELVRLGVLSAEESELSMHQILPPQNQSFGNVVGTGSAGMLGGAGLWEQNNKLQDMLSEANYLKYLQQAIAFDEQWSRSLEVKDARKKVFDVLNNIFVV